MKTVAQGFDPRGYRIAALSPVVGGVAHGAERFHQPHHGGFRKPRRLMQQLDRDWPVVLQVLGEEHGRHAAAAELPLDGVALGERVTQSFDKISHWAAARLAKSQPSIACGTPPR